MPEPGSPRAGLCLAPVKRACHQPAQEAAGGLVGKIPPVKDSAGGAQESGLEARSFPLPWREGVRGSETWPQGDRGDPPGALRPGMSPSSPALGIHPHLQGLGVPALLRYLMLVFGKALLDGQLLIPLISRLIPHKALLGIGIGAD
jgi:hypothetical protein